MTSPLRALPYREFSVAWTFSPILDEVVDRVPGALLAVLADPAAIGPQTLLLGDPPAEVVARSVERTPETLTAAGAIDRVRNSATPTHPLQVLLSGERITFAVSHALLDGLGIGELIAAVMAVAIGEPPKLDTRPPMRFPLLAGLKAVGPAGVRSYLATRRSAVIIGPEIGADVVPGHSRALEMAIPPELFHRIEHLSVAGRATSAARLASVAICALGRVHRRDVDIPVSVPVSLRRHVGNRRVLGNFVGIEPVGTLHGSPWTPDRITARLAEATRSGRAMAGLAYAVVRAVRYRVLPAPLTVGHARVAVSMQMISLPNVIPDRAWAGPEWGTCAATIGPWPSSTALAPGRMGNRWGVSVWDESGEFDLDAFPAALRAEVAARESAGASPR